MAQRKGEGALDWLNQQLTSPWHGHQTVAGGLTNEIIHNIRERWSQLDSAVRLGVLFSLISLKKAQQVQLKDMSQELIDHACSDPDDWVRLVSQMLKDYPTEGTLRFNVEQFADQAQLGSLMKGLTDHIAKDGIKFHPKEFAYLSESVCKSGQGRDPRTNEYPPMTGPSLQSHFTLLSLDNHASIHKNRSERLKKMAEQVSPAVALAGSSASLGSVFDSTGASLGSSSAGSDGGKTVGASGVTTIPGGAGSGPAVGGSRVPGVAGSSAAGVGGSSSAAAATSQQGLAGVPGPGGSGLPARPVRSSSSGLFVKSKSSASSFLRNNAPRPTALPRMPSVGQIPISTAPRGNPKASRIQILDIQQGNEIMQSMNDAKLKIEQDEKREKELKREQKLQEAEIKKQQEAEKKAQLLREKEEKKKEKEDARRAKEKVKQEKEEQAAAAAAAQRERERLEQERERLEQEREQQLQQQAQPQSQSKETRALDEVEGEDPNEASLSSVPARKKTRLSSSRRGSRDEDDDYDGEDYNGPQQRPGPINTGGYQDYSPMSPATPGLTSTYARQSLHDMAPSGQHSSNDPSYFQHQSQSQQHHYPASEPMDSPPLTIEHPTLFQDTNLLRPEDRRYISAFLQGHPVVRPNENDTMTQIVMNQEQVQDANGKTMYELIVIEMNFETGEWRKIKRRRNKPHRDPSTVAPNGS